MRRFKSNPAAAVLQLRVRNDIAAPREYGVIWTWSCLELQSDGCSVHNSDDAVRDACAPCTQCVLPEEGSGTAAGIPQLGSLHRCAASKSRWYATAGGVCSRRCTAFAAACMFTTGVHPDSA